MVCESWKAKLETYLDGELPEEEMRAFDVHVRNCPSCSADALIGVQMKRAIRIAGKRFNPSVEFRKRNMVLPSEMPHTSPVDKIYDSGDFHRVLGLVCGRILP